MITLIIKLELGLTLIAKLTPIVWQKHSKPHRVQVQKQINFSVLYT